VHESLIDKKLALNAAFMSVPIEWLLDSIFVVDAAGEGLITTI